VRCSVDLALHLGGIQGPYGSDSILYRNAVWCTGQLLHCQEVRSNRNKSIGSELVGDGADPGGKPENLVYYDYHRRLGLTLRVDNPGA
jgi:hypothetical protein